MTSPYLRIVHWSLLIASCLSLVACQSLTAAVTPYKMDIVQGNFVSKEQAAALATGMNRLQVRSILGTPLLASVFHGDRWDYVFTIRRQGVAPQERRVTVFFKADVLERVVADELPSEVEFVASLDSGRKLGKVPQLQATEESLKNFPSPSAKPVPTPAISGSTSYPPLEPAGR